MRITAKSIIFMLCMVLITFGATLAEPVDSAKFPASIRSQMDAAISTVGPCLVRVRVVSVEYSQGREMKLEGTGSGVIISKDGHVVTNHHVAGLAKRVVCTLADKEEIEADLVGADALSDLAVLKLKPASPRDFAYAQFGDSSKLAVGDTVLSMGSPLSLSQSVTLGIVSNVEMVMPELYWPFNRLEQEGEDVGSMVRWIGHDAPIYPGNSGGPLVDLQGRIVGINEISMGLGGAIPGNLAKDVAEQLIKEGKVRRSWIGVQVQPLLKDSGRKDGVLVSSVISDSPADKAGVKAGDLILKIAGKDVSVRFSEELPLFNQMVAAFPVGEEIESHVLRSGQIKVLKIKTEERQEAKPKEREFTEWGFAASNISLLQAKEMQRPDQDGVLIRSMRPGGPADQAKPQVFPGDVIYEVAGKPIKSVSDLAAETAKIVQGKEEPVPVLVGLDRQKDKYLTVVKVGIRKTEDPGLEVQKAWLPIASQVITKDLAEALGVQGKTGVRVTRIFPESEAEKAGLAVGDLIIALDDQEIPASQPEDTQVLPVMIRQYKIGSTAELSVLRGKEQKKISVTLPPSPKLAREMKSYRDLNFEFTARDVTFHDRTKQNWDGEAAGVYVEAVSEGGWAALGRLAVGDLIQSIDGTPVADVESLEAMMQAIAEKKPKTVVLQVKRGIYQMFVELQPSWPEEKL